MKPKLLLGLALVLSGGFWLARAGETNAIQPSAAELFQLKAQQQELCALLAKSSLNGLDTNTSNAVKHQPSEDWRYTSFPVNESRLRADSLYLAESENAQLLKLLSDQKVSKAVSHDLALAVLNQWVKQWEKDGCLPRWHYNNLMAVVNERWPHDPAVIALFREALATEGDVAIWELWSPAPGAWDDVMQEPAIRLIEKAAAESERPQTNALKEAPWFVAQNALGVLNGHYSVWATNNTIPPRLSKAILTLFPSLTNASMSGPRPGNQMWLNAIKMLTETHDPAMIAVLRPYLDQRGLAGDAGGLGFGVTAMRTCDEAANAIFSLLGDKTNRLGFWDSGRADASIQSGQRAYPKWPEWDQKISELQKRLDALPQKTNSTTAKP